MERRIGERRIGALYGVGVGPGDPELMTVKSIKVLEAVPVIAVPSSTRPEVKLKSRALQIVRGALSFANKEVLALYMPMTRDRALSGASREKAAGAVVERLEAGRDVAFVTVGDPSLYSTFGYLAPLVKEALPEVRIVVIPGVSSINAAASLTGAPIAEADEKVIIVPAGYSIDELRGWLKSFDTVVLMKVNKRMEELATLLDETGLFRSATFASMVGWPDEEVVTDIRSLKGRETDYFSIVIIKTGCAKVPA
jgi:precorrin-2/cobalt-factor-2 C20-methyltransferase